MSGSANQRLLPTNVTLLQPGSRYFRLSDALTQQQALIAAGANATISNAQLLADLAVLRSEVTTLQSQVSTLQGQVQLLQQFQNSFSYLQAEVSTGTLFLDQRNIYKRSFVINNALNNGLTNFVYAHNIANINYIVNIEAMAALNGQQQLPITFINMATAPSISIGISLWADTTNIIISLGTQTFPNYQVLATLWYTATDR